jgi:hypothetical protein
MKERRASWDEREESKYLAQEERDAAKPVEAREVGGEVGHLQRLQDLQIRLRMSEHEDGNQGPSAHACNLVVLT